MLPNLRTKVWSKSKIEANVHSSIVKTAKIWKQPECPSTDEWIKKTWYIYTQRGFPGGASGKESANQCRRSNGLELDLWVRKVPWSRKWQPTLVFLPQKFHGQKSLVGYHPWVLKESDTTEHRTHIHMEYYSAMKKNKLCHFLQHRWTWSALC